MHRLHVYGIIVSLISAIFLHSATTAWAADNYIYPLDSWNVTTTHGEEISDGYYHMGVDAGFDLEAGDPVYAVADGLVMEAKERSQFGLVVLIEHTLENGSKNVSLYGHLRPSDVRVSPGQAVKAGDIIGVLGAESENGGWSIHLHFGIHKQPYSETWIYYGHVRDAAVANDWFDPEKYIPNHLTTDAWAPELSWDVENGQVVEDDIFVHSVIREKGSGIASVRYQAKATANDSWQTLVYTTEHQVYQTLDTQLGDFPDGDIRLRLIVKDKFKNKAKIAATIAKDPERFTTPAFITSKTKSADGGITQWSFAGNQLSTVSPQLAVGGGTDVTVADVTGDGNLNIITAQGSATITSRVRVFTGSGAQLNSWRTGGKGSIRVAAGNIQGNDRAEIIVGSSSRQIATVRAYKRNGTLLWELQPFLDVPRSGLDVATGDINADGYDEVIVATRGETTARIAVISSDGTQVLRRFKPFGESSIKLNVTSGDITGDGTAYIIVGSGGKKNATIKVFTGKGEFTGISFAPFGENFSGDVDVGLTQWDENTGPLELIASQASSGQAWVKLYRLQDPEELLQTNRLYEETYTAGARVAGWQ